MHSGPIILLLSLQMALGTRFHEDCTPVMFHSKDRFRFNCKVLEGCVDALRPRVPSKSAPGVPHDLRITSYSVINPSSRPFSYELHVNITWEPAYDESQNRTTGFDLETVLTGLDRRHCFLFYLPNVAGRWESQDRLSPPKFRLSTVDVFQWGKDYTFSLMSLPQAQNPNPEKSTSLNLRENMPNHPDEPPISGPVNCSEHVNPAAHSWVAAFKRVDIRPWLNEIKAEFFTAPRHYCFEEYEIRLHRHDNQGILQAQIVPESELYEEKYGNVTVRLGNHTFENVSAGLYDIGLVPVERSQKLDWKCLCPTTKLDEHTEDSHKRVVCSCTEAMWPKVEMHNPMPPSTVNPLNSCLSDPTAPGCPGYVAPSETSPKSHVNGTIIFTTMLFAAALALIIGFLILIIYWKRYRSKGSKMGAARLLPASIYSTGQDAVVELMPWGGGTDSLPPIRVLLIYSHDCPPHERTIKAFADLLQSSCNCYVDMDVLSASQIAVNKADWIFQSISNADKVLIINSQGAFMRYNTSQICDGQTGDRRFLERKDPSTFDDLFLLQMNLIREELYLRNQTSHYQKFMMVHFAYTPLNFLISDVLGMYKYELPTKIHELACWLHQIPQNASAADNVHPLRHMTFERLPDIPLGATLLAAHQEMSQFQETSPHWFQEFHVLNEPQSLISVDHSSRNSNASSSDSGLASLPVPLPPLPALLPPLPAQAPAPAPAPLCRPRAASVAEGATLPLLPHTDSDEEEGEGTMTDSGFLEPQLERQHGSIGEKMRQPTASLSSRRALDASC